MNRYIFFLNKYTYKLFNKNKTFKVIILFERTFCSIITYDHIYRLKNDDVYQ